MASFLLIAFPHSSFPVKRGGGQDGRRIVVFDPPSAKLRAARAFEEGSNADAHRFRALFPVPFAVVEVDVFNRS